MSTIKPVVKATEWRKAPSVTPGGKPYFWVANVRGERVTIVWDRAVRAYAVRLDRPGTPLTVAFYSDPKDAMRACEATE